MGKEQEFRIKTDMFEMKRTIKSNKWFGYSKAQEPQVRRNGGDNVSMQRPKRYA